MEPDQILRGAADFFKEKNNEHGSTYERHGKLMSIFFPEGITLKTKEDFGRFHILSLLVLKMNRISGSLNKGIFHEDSYCDLMIYSSMALSLNEKERK